MKILQILDPLDFEEMWPMASFHEAYQKEPTLITGCSLIASGNLTQDPDKSALIIFRAFIENGRSVKNDQKYVLGIRFYSFGDMATIDLISLDRGYHRDMAYEHIQKFDWPIMDDTYQRSLNKVQETMHAPFIFVGGHLAVGDGNKVALFSDSGDYGGHIFFSNINDIASFVLSTISGVTATGGNIETGKNIIQGIMDLMDQHKLQPDFYEKLVEYVNRQPIHGSGFTAQHIGALLMMKVKDRIIRENGDFLSTIVDEMSGGLGRYILISGVAKNIRLNKMPNE